MFPRNGGTIYDVSGYKNPLALCSPIPVKSTDSDCYTYHDVALEGTSVDPHNCILVSLYRLHLNPVMKWYGEKNTLSFSPLKMGVYQFNDNREDSFFL